jgi:hypothetical protein
LLPVPVQEAAVTLGVMPAKNASPSRSVRLFLQLVCRHGCFSLTCGRRYMSCVSVTCCLAHTIQQLNSAQSLSTSKHPTNTFTCNTPSSLHHIRHCSPQHPSHISLAISTFASCVVSLTCSRPAPSCTHCCSPPCSSVASFSSPRRLPRPQFEISPT